MASGTNQRSLLETELLELGPLSWRGWCGVGLLAAIFAVGFAAFLYQLRHGLAVTAMTDYFSWGVYIINFVFFIGISMAGSLICALSSVMVWRISCMAMTGRCRRAN